MGLLGSYCENIPVDYISEDLCIWDSASGKAVTTYSLGGGSSTGYPAQWSPDHTSFYSYLAWQRHSLRVGKLGITHTVFVPGPDFSADAARLDS